MVELMLNTYVCSILFYSRDVSKFVCLIPQLRFIITVKSCNVKGLHINNIKNLINECLKDEVCGVFSLFDCKGENQHREERALYF